VTTTELSFEPALDRPDLLAAPTAKAVGELGGALPSGGAVEVAEIDPDLADTAAFCATYGIGLDESANCVIVAAKRAGEVTYAACLVLATTRADINGLARRHLGARKISFAPMDDAVALTGMQYGGITPVGLPEGWPILIDPAVAAQAGVVVGSGIRGSKLRVPGAVLAGLPGAEVLEGLGVPVPAAAAAGDEGE
jgi:prolyl-tRNA editing enzyme YbaK/EbsC (Cys-tRNA(Pro) deacylase)